MAENTLSLALPQQPPQAEKRPLICERHGVQWRDDYAWLKAGNWQEVLRDPATLADDIRAYLTSENAYSSAALEPTKVLQEKIYEEIKDRLKADDSSVPTPDGDWVYYTRYRLPNADGTEGHQPLECRRPRNATEGKGEQILLDGDKRAAGLKFYSTGDLDVSPQQTRMAWSEDTAGSEFYSIRVRDVLGMDGMGAEAPDVVEQTSGSVVWASDGQGFFYVRLTDNHRPDGVYYHQLGTAVSSDPCIYREADGGFFVNIGASMDRSHLVIVCSDHETSECLLVPLAAPLQNPLQVIQRQTGVKYSVELHPDFNGVAGVFIKTNTLSDSLADAPDRQIGHVALAALPLSSWQEVQPIVGHEEGRLIQSFGVLRGWLVWLEMEKALPRLRVRRISKDESRAEQLIEMPEEAYSLGFDLGYEFASDTLRYHYSSLTTPGEVWQVDLRSGERKFLKRQEIPSGHNPADYMTRRLWAQGADGARVPVTVLYRPDMVTPEKPDQATFLTGYGAYGHINPARFREGALSLVDRGWVWAMAHVRGGREQGEMWYRQGKLEHKTNTFSDFIDSARALVAQGYSQNGRIVAQGGSAGGMLMGAIANRAPEGLFGAIIADVPFVDVLNTMMDAELPLTPPEWPEWGNPGADAEAFARIRGYSPYDNVTAKAYPPLLVQAGLTDPRVTYWEPAKWVARLRELKTDDNPLLLVTNMTAGHAGASGRYERIREVARELAFAIAVCDAEKA